MEDLGIGITRARNEINDLDTAEQQLRDALQIMARQIRELQTSLLANTSYSAAAVLAGLIGWDREAANKPAGISKVGAQIS